AGRVVSTFQKNQRAIVVGRRAAGECGDIGERRFENVPRRPAAQVHHVAQHPLFPEPLATGTTSVRPTIGEETENGLATLEVLHFLLAAITEPQWWPGRLQPPDRSI